MQHLSQEAAKGAVEGQYMNIYEIGMLMTGWVLSSVWFYTMGINTGYLEGRKAVRKFYEQRDKVRA
jgi:hypothetical protein